ncbi:MAG: hypothetical protein NTX64_00995 [Elusimicrobia bacterium]|nr:hypothetical protein [Elusimicrobiota bacterium]
MVNFVIVTHGEFGAYLVEAAESIVGRQGEGVAVVSISARLSVDEVRRRVEEALRELDGAGGVIVATDIPGGTPSNVVLLAAKDMPGVRVLSGLNLYMLISGFGNRRTLGLEELAAKMLADGQRSIRDMKAALLSKAHR